MHRYFLCSCVCVGVYARVYGSASDIVKCMWHSTVRACGLKKVVHWGKMEALIPSIECLGFVFVVSPCHSYEV